MITIEDFLEDSQGKRFRDVVDDSRLDFGIVINYFNRKDIARRLEDSEINHKRPALAGVVVELESLEEIKKFFESQDAHSTVRFRQAIGVLVKLHMLKNGWKTTGFKGSLGIRNPSLKYENTAGSLSRWFTKAERYEKT